MPYNSRADVCHQIATRIFEANRSIFTLTEQITQPQTLKQTQKFKWCLNIWLLQFGFFLWWHTNLHGLSNAKAILVEHQWFLTYKWGRGMEVHTFPKGIRPNVNAVFWDECRIKFLSYDIINRKKYLGSKFRCLVEARIYLVKNVE